MATPGRKPKGANKSVKKEIYPSPELEKFIQEVAKRQDIKSFSGAVCWIIQEWKECSQGSQKGGLN